MTALIPIPADATVLHGDGAPTIRRALRPRSIDMVYLDPPYYTQEDWTGPAGSFSDRWRWDDAAARRLDDAGSAADWLVLAACGDRSLLAYLLAMRELVAACHWALKGHGSLWLQCDVNASAALRLMLDSIFGPARYWGDVIWHRHVAHNMNVRCYPNVFDTVFVYARSGATVARLSRPAGQGHDCEMDGVRGRRIAGWTDRRLSTTSRERVGYPTQKPIDLLRDLISWGSLPGDHILDPCCGSGTTIVAALDLGRRATGIDQSADAVRATRKRIAARQSFQPDLFGEFAR